MSLENEKLEIARKLIKENRRDLSEQLLGVAEKIMTLFESEGPRGFESGFFDRTKEEIIHDFDTDVENERMGLGTISFSVRNRLRRVWGLHKVEDRSTSLIIHLNSRPVVTVGRQDFVTNRQICAAETTYSDINVQCGQTHRTIFYNLDGIQVIGSPKINDYREDDRKLMKWLVAENKTPFGLLKDYEESLRRLKES